MFKAFSGRPRRLLNLNKLHVRTELARSGKVSRPSLALSPNYCTHMILGELKRTKAEWGYGGLWENRGNVWDGSYITEQKKPYHLGWDWYVPAETVVSADCALNVLRIGSDHPEPYGWGGHVISRVIGKPYVLIMGHIRPDKNLREGDMLKPGEDYARIDTPATNGGWFAHGHSQLLTVEAWQYFNVRFSELDGYCSKDDLPRAKELFLDPIEVGVIKVD